MYQDYCEIYNYSITKTLRLTYLSQIHFRTLLFQLAPEMSINDIKRACEKRWRVEFQQFRMFTQEGIEMFKDDIDFLKDQTKLYITKGQDFDANVIYSEYQILEELGQGGFGKVLLGIHKETEQKVAIKMVSAKNRNAQDIEMVFREALLMKSLDHRNIVKFYNCLALSNMQMIFVMEYLEGGDLLNYLEFKGHLAESEAKDLFRQICEAIQYCHNKRLIHRDLKLENIMFTDEDKKYIKIVDFGIAGLAINANTDANSIGTLKYMAPELLHSDHYRLGPTVDIWALGVILYLLIFGCMPFNGNTKYELIRSIMLSDYRFPKTNTSAELIDLISRIFIVDPNKRIKLYDILNHSWLLEQEPMEQQDRRIRINPIPTFKLPPIVEERPLAKILRSPRERAVPRLVPLMHNRRKRSYTSNAATRR